MGPVGVRVETFDGLQRFTGASKVGEGRQIGLKGLGVAVKVDNERMRRGSGVGWVGAGVCSPGFGAGFEPRFDTR